MHPKPSSFPSLLIQHAVHNPLQNQSLREEIDWYGQAYATPQSSTRTDEPSQSASRAQSPRRTEDLEGFRSTSASPTSKAEGLAPPSRALADGRRAPHAAALTIGTLRVLTLALWHQQSPLSPTRKDIFDRRRLSESNAG